MLLTPRSRNNPLFYGRWRGGWANGRGGESANGCADKSRSLAPSPCRRVAVSPCRLSPPPEPSKSTLAQTDEHLMMQQLDFNAWLLVVWTDGAEYASTRTTGSIAGGTKHQRHGGRCTGAIAELESRQNGARPDGAKAQRIYEGDFPFRRGAACGTRRSAAPAGIVVSRRAEQKGARIPTESSRSRP